MAIFVAKGHSQDPQTMGQVRLLGGCVYYAEYGISKCLKCKSGDTISGLMMHKHLPFVYIEYSELFHSFTWKPSMHSPSKETLSHSNL